MSAAESDIAALAASAVELARVTASQAAPVLRLTELGKVTEIGPGVARVKGLGRAAADEVVTFASGARGVVADLTEAGIGITLLDGPETIAVGHSVRRTGEIVSVPVGDGLLGRAVDPLGRPLDGRGQVAARDWQPAEAPAPSIAMRAPVQRPLATGLKVIDAAVPVGLGQRELIIGDRQTGKTSIAVDTILSQRHSDVVCVYCAIGQRADAVARVMTALADGDMRTRTIMVIAAGDAAPGLAFLAPYAATTMAEHFVAQGQDVLIVYDDLTRHARAYRELSLLLRRPPGREAYPGDIFYVHARLLERSGQFNARGGGGSLTALPVLETQAENLSAYIPTNLISITDGQIYLSPRLFEMGRLPAVDLGRSVSRVGGKAQLPALRAVAGDLRIVMSQFAELEAFARFGTRLDAETKAKLARGHAVRDALLQAERQPLTATAQVVQLIAANAGLLDNLESADRVAALQRLEKAADQFGTLADRIASGAPLEKADHADIVQRNNEILDGAA